MIVKPQPDRIDQHQPAHRFRRERCDFGGKQAAERVADQRRSFEPERVEQFAVTDEQVVPVVEMMGGFSIALAGAGKFRRMDGVAFGEPRDEGAVRREAPGPVQVNERRPVACDLDLGLDPSLPELEPANFGGGHALSLRQEASAIEAAAVNGAARFVRRRSGHQRSSYWSSH